MQHWESQSAPSVSLARKTCPYMFTIQLSLTSATSTDCICPESRQSSCQPGLPAPAPRDPTGRPVSTDMKQVLQAFVLNVYCRFAQRIFRARVIVSAVQRCRQRMVNLTHLCIPTKMFALKVNHAAMTVRNPVFYPFVSRLCLMS
jgi:hypothetical protein